MQHLLFWRQWPKGYQALYLLILLIFAAASATLAAGYILGYDAVLDWYMEGNVEQVPFVMEEFSRHLFRFPLKADGYLITESFRASSLALNQWAYWLFGLLSLAAMLVLLTAIPDMSRIWFWAGGGTFMLYIVNMKWELLGLLNHYHDMAFSAVLTGAFLLPAVFFHFKSHAGIEIHYGWRLLVYVAVAAGGLTFTALYSPHPAPFMLLAANSLIIPLLLGILFCVLVAHEWLRGIVYMVTFGNAPGSRHTARHLLVAGGVYLLNLAYFYFHSIRLVDWGLYTLHPFLLFIGSAWIGIWGFRSRQTHYEGMMPFAPTGAFLYLGLGILALSGAGFSLLTANDPLLEVYEDVILFTHLGLGFSFAVYVAGNFLDPILQNRPVYQILYQPRTMDFLSSMVIGILLMIVFLARSNFFTYQQAYAGYFNTQADVSRAEGERFIAAQLFQVATGYDPMNHRAYYTLGTLAEEEGNRLGALLMYKECLRKNPLPQSYIKIATLQQQQNQYFEALFTLQEGAKRFPKSGELLNNLALQFNKSDLADSVYYYFSLAKKFSNRPEIAESNLFALLTKYDFDGQEAQQLYQLDKDYVTAFGNELAWLNKTGQATARPFRPELLGDSSLATPQMCYLYNYALNQRANVDSAFIKRLEAAALEDANAAFRPYLLFALSAVHQAQGNALQSWKVLRQAYELQSELNSFYPNFLGLRALQQGHYASAASFFRTAHRRGHPDGLLHQAIALSELPDKQEARQAWQELLTHQDSARREVARNMLRLLEPSIPLTEWLLAPSTPDLTRYQLLHYHLPAFSPEQYLAGVAAMDTAAYQVAALTDALLAAVELGRPEQEARPFFDRLNEVKVPENLLPLYHYCRFSWLHHTGKMTPALFEEMKTTAFPPEEEGKKRWFLANWMSRGNANATPEQTIAAYREALGRLPFEERLYLEFADYLRASQQGRAAYDLLLEATQELAGSAVLWEAYALECLNQGFASYASFAADRMADLVSPARYQAFLTLYNQKKAEMEKRFDQWE